MTTVWPFSRRDTRELAAGVRNVAAERDEAERKLTEAREASEGVDQFLADLRRAIALGQRQRRHRGA